MITFPSLKVDDQELQQIAEDAFYKYVGDLKSDSMDRYIEYFGTLPLSQLKSELIQIDYTKYNQKQDLLFFDSSTDFHVQVTLHIYVRDADGDKQVACSYMLVLNSELEPVDDFLR